MIIEYKGYVATAEFDQDAGLFHGEVTNTHDVITFQGDRKSNLRQAFINSVEDHLEFCTTRGEEPEIPHTSRSGSATALDRR